MLAMGQITIPIVATEPLAQPACGGCVLGTTVASCRPVLVRASQPPQLSGPRDELQRLIAGLAAQLGFPANAPESGGVRALRVLPGEVELELAYEPQCGGGAELADAAFRALRGLLPDTDIFVRPAA